MRQRAAIALIAALVAGAAVAASRARFGGELRIVAPESARATEPALADTLPEAALSRLTSPPVCRLEVDGRVRPVLVDALTRLGALRLRLAPAARGPTAAEIGERWERLTRTATLSPYRALLFPLRGEGRGVSRSASAGALELSLSFPWPDLERALCHPALGVPGAHGPFTRSAGGAVLSANARFAGGRPFVDSARVLRVSDREAARLVALDQADVVLAPAEDSSAVPPPALYATYLAFRPSRVGPDLRQSVERAVDRADLTRFFVRGPAVAMSALLPPALMPQPVLPASPPGAAAPREVTLVYDRGIDDQRAVAERLQVKLHDRGYRVALQPLPREQLRRLWARGDFDLMLHGVLLPPIPAVALSLVIDLAGRHDLLAAELPQLGAVTDSAARDALARQRAEALRDQLMLIPLYAQAIGVRAGPRVQALAFDGFGLPILDDAFLMP